MDPKEERKFTSLLVTAQRTLDRVAHEVKKYETNTYGISERAADSLGRKLEQVETSLASIPATMPDHTTVSSQLSATRAAYQALIGKQSAADTEKESIEALYEARKASGEMAADTEILMKVAELANGVMMLEPGSGHFKYIWTADDDVRRSLALIETWNAVKANAQTVFEKYDKTALRRIRGVGDLTHAHSLYEGARQSLTHAFETFEGRAVARLATLRSSFDTLNAAAQSEGQFGPFIGTQSPVALLRSETRMLARIGNGLNATRVVREAGTFLEVINEAEEALREQIVAQNTPWHDDYRGEDRDAMKALAKAEYLNRFPDADIVDVRLPFQWKRTAEWRYDKSDEAWSLRDVSRATAWVIEKTTDTLATQWLVELFRHHLDGDRMTGVVARTDDKVPSPHQQVLLSRLNH